MLGRMGASEELIAAAANGQRRKVTGLPSMLVDWRTTDAPWQMPEPSRELQFLLSGRNPDDIPLAASGLFGRLDGDGWFDTDVGGDVVGNRAQGLSMATSRIDVEMLPDANAAYVEWTAEFANGSDGQREARLTLALPEGGVASRATLWVDGEPREASFAARGAVRAAYQSVVSVQRDPLLVTTDGSGRLLVQAFPVPAGKRLKLRIGVTAPLLVAADGARSVGLPAIVRRNFSVDPKFLHNLRVEGATGAAGIAMSGRRAADGRIFASGHVPDPVLRNRMARLDAPPLRGATTADGMLGGIAVRQSIRLERNAAAGPLVLLVDGSASNREGVAALLRSLDGIAPGYPVGLVFAGKEVRQVAAAPWSAGQKARVRRALSGERLEGGHDNVPGLMLAMESAGSILWVHGAQPVRFAQSTADLEAVLDRARGALPTLVRLQSAPGPAFGLPGRRWLETARDVAPAGGACMGIGPLLQELTGAAPHWAIRRESLKRGVEAAGTRGGGHIVRLWAAQEAAVARGEQRAAAASRAAGIGVVSADTGAVVLESDAETLEKGLPAAPAITPAVPEPGAWMMMIAGFYLLGWQLRRRLAEIGARAG